MLLKRIAIRDLAGIVDVDLPDLSPGINVLVGDNETGKSTVLTALRAAIFYRHGSGARFVKDLAPYAKGARPEVDLHFSLGGMDYVLEKRFLQKPEARLQFGAQTLTGDAVEEKLAELFGFQPVSGMNFDREKHQGTFGLLWVEQGRSAHGLDLGEGRDAVAASLEAEVKQILGGDRGRDLIAAAKALRDRTFTTSGKVGSNSALAVAEKRLAGLDAALGEQRTRRKTLDETIDRLADRRRIAATFARDRVVETARAALAAAEAADRGLESRRRDLTEAVQAAEIATAAVERAADERARRLELRESYEKAVLAQQAAAGRLTEARRAAAASADEALPLSAAEAEAAAALEALRAELGDAERSGRQAELSHRLERLGEMLGASREAQGRLAAAQAGLRHASLDAKGLAAIQAADAARREAAIGRDAMAPVILLRPDPGRLARLSDAAPALDPERPLRITGRTRIVLDGYGALDVVPDAASETREADLARAEGVLRQLLAKAGVETLDAALRLREATIRQQADVREAEVELKARAPEGLPALEAEESLVANALAELSKSAGEGGDGKRATPARTVSVLRDEIGIAETRLAEARRALERRRASESGERTLLARAESQLETTSTEAERLGRLLAEAERHAADAALTERLAVAEAMRGARTAAAARMKEAFEATEPEVIRRDVERCRRSLENVERDLATVEEDIRNLEAEIRQTGGLAIGEEIARLAEEREVAAGELARLSLEAHAARLLHDTLKAAEARVRRTWFEPIRREVEPYLRLIHPGSAVELDDATLALTGLTRAGVAEDFQKLSTGAREQVAVVTRLALAQVLRRAGRPATVILDDALVNTDERRLERMHRVLERASEQLQILVLTCRESDFRGFGDRTFRL